ncbi:MAG: hypothetical protein ABI443_12620, partial [Chthoniobacterales bacterium]
SITQVLLRLFALNWVVMGIVQFVSLSYTFQNSHPSFLNYSAPICFTTCGVFVWIFAPFLSHQFSRGNDASLTLQGITLRQMYSTTFVGLGLYFSLTSFANVFNWLHYVIITQSGESTYHNANSSSYYQLSQSAMTLAAGIFIIVTADIWARKLSVKHSSE